MLVRKERQSEKKPKRLFHTTNRRVLVMIEREDATCVCYQTALLEP